LRIICHGGYKHVLGLETSKAGLATETTFWGNVIVSPLEGAYVDRAMEPLYENDSGKSGEARSDGLN
uniref:Dirigent protein n=1 Tax=Gongylonema pulchrum TaxID=637853 RepID=A0A183EHZ9_9BILA